MSFKLKTLHFWDCIYMFYRCPQYKHHISCTVGRLLLRTSKEGLSWSLELLKSDSFIRFKAWLSLAKTYPLPLLNLSSHRIISHPSLGIMVLGKKMFQP